VAAAPHEPAYRVARASYCFLLCRDLYAAKASDYAGNFHRRISWSDGTAAGLDRGTRSY